MNEHTLSMIIVAGGLGKRMGETLPKQFLPLRGKPILLWSLETFLQLPFVAEIVIVLPPEWLDEGMNMVKKISSSLPIYVSSQKIAGNAEGAKRPTAGDEGCEVRAQNLAPLLHPEGGRVPPFIKKLPIYVSSGGKERQDSVKAGMNALTRKDGWVGVHDAARPGISGKLVEDLFQTAVEKGCAIPVLPMVDTVVRGKAGKVVERLIREEVFRIQTPQIFSYAVLEKALETAQANETIGSDDSGLVAALGQEIFYTLGSERNLKITTELDLQILETLL